MSNTGEKKGISALDFFCVGLGSIVGVGWSLSIHKWMANCGGPLPAAVGYILALVMMIPVSLCYCELAPMMPVAGGGTAYAYRAFNEKVAFISGWAAFGGFVTIIPWEAIYVCDVFSILIPQVKGPLLYNLADADVYLGHIIFGTIFSILLFAINWKGATGSALFQRIITLTLVFAGILAMIAALAKLNFSNFQPYYQFIEGRGSMHNSFFTGALAILASAPFFLAGFETIPQAVEDAEGDVTSVGKTVVLSVGLACIFYALLLFCLGGAMPWLDFWQDGARPTPAGGTLFREIYPGSPVGSIMYYVILVGTLCGLFSTWNGFMMASPRLLMGMARGYMMPRALAKQNKYGTPTNGLIACLILSLAGPFLGMGLIDPLTTFSAAGFVTSWMVTSYSVISLRRKEPNAERPYKMPGGSATAWFSALVMSAVFIMLFIPQGPMYMSTKAVILFICWMAFGFILYMIAGPARNAVSVEERKRSLFARKGEL